MKKALSSTVLFGVLAAVSGCSFAARSPEMYRDDTAALLDTKSAEIKACYDEALKTNASATGTVRVQFTVAKETGKITNPTVDPAGTTAPAEVSSCVTSKIDGLELKPPDQNDGQATFTWEFQAEAPPAPAPAEPAPAG